MKKGSLDDVWPPLDKRTVYSVMKALLQKQISIKDGSGIIHRFESAFSRWLGVKHCLAQNSGTSTLHSAVFLSRM